MDASRIFATHNDWPTCGTREIWKRASIIHNHVEGLFEQGGIKLSSVVSDLFGVGGWAMLEHIGKGVTDVDGLVKLARGVLRKKDSELKEALAGRLDPVYQLLLRQHMEQVRLLRKQIEELSQALAAEGPHRGIATG